MEPSEVRSSQDIRDGWDEWSYSERVEALDTLANETLDQYEYENDVYVDTGDAGNYSGEYNSDDGSIVVDPFLIEDPNPNDAIHLVNHETVHAMNDEDGIDDNENLNGEDLDFEAAGEALIEHQNVGDIARELNNDGLHATQTANNRSNKGSEEGSESGSSPEDPKTEDFEAEIDWSQGVWVDSTDENGNMTVDIMFQAPEGW